MDITTQLIIRACKSRDPMIRLISVYNRRYLKSSNPKSHIVNILSEICDKYLDISIFKLLNDLNPNNIWEEENKKDYPTICMYILMSNIRFSEAKLFPGCKPPIFFRNRGME